MALDRELMIESSLHGRVEQDSLTPFPPLPLLGIAEVGIKLVEVPRVDALASVPSAHSLFVKLAIEDDAALG